MMVGTCGNPHPSPPSSVCRWSSTRSSRRAWPRTAPTDTPPQARGRRGPPGPHLGPARRRAPGREQHGATAALSVPGPPDRRRRRRTCLLRRSPARRRFDLATDAASTVQPRRRHRCRRPPPLLPPAGPRRLGAGGGHRPPSSEPCWGSCCTWEGPRTHHHRRSHRRRPPARGSPGRRSYSPCCRPGWCVWRRSWWREWCGVVGEAAAATGRGHSPVGRP